MNLYKNYYKILGVSSNSEQSEIKKSYYKLSRIYHPDKNKTDDPNIFIEILESYEVLSDPKTRSEYDMNSKFGADYNELNELLLVDMDIDYKSTENKYKQTKQRELLDIYIDIDDTFNGEIQYARWVMCGHCEGSGKDKDNRIIIRDEFGNIKSIFEPDDGCDFCEGTGKDWRGITCNYCGGNGKIGSKPCSKCEGERRILGKQTLSNIKLSGGVETILDFMGNASYYDHGKKGRLILIKRD